MAKLTGYKSYDTDAEIVQKHGNISDIFARFGEAYFRDLETQTVKELAKEQNAILSVGGGLVLRQENVEILKKTGKIVYLRASLDTLTKRLQGDTARPLLQGEEESLQDKLTRLLNARGAIYEKAADLVLDVDDKSPQAIAKQLLEKLG